LIGRDLRATPLLGNGQRLRRAYGHRDTALAVLFLERQRGVVDRALQVRDGYLNRRGPRCRGLVGQIRLIEPQEIRPCSSRDQQHKQQRNALPVKRHQQPPKYSSPYSHACCRLSLTRYPLSRILSVSSQSPLDGGRQHSSATGSLTQDRSSWTYCRRSTRLLRSSSYSMVA